MGFAAWIPAFRGNDEKRRGELDRFLRIRDQWLTAIVVAVGVFVSFSASGERSAADGGIRGVNMLFVLFVAHQFYARACELSLEGIISKRADAPYAPGNRGLWVKVKCLNREEFVVVGWTDPEGSRPRLGALLLAYYTPDGRMVYAGRAGVGINNTELERLWRRLQPLAISENLLRQVIYQGLREDKDPTEVRRPVPNQPAFAAST
jgi:ATP dependent DNA ligase-like protein